MKSPYSIPGHPFPKFLSGFPIMVHAASPATQSARKLLSMPYPNILLKITSAVYHWATKKINTVHSKTSVVRKPLQIFTKNLSIVVHIVRAGFRDILNKVTTVPSRRKEYNKNVVRLQICYPHCHAY